MAIDTRREIAHIQREFQRRQCETGEAVIWFMFDPDRTTYDDVYDEGFRRYKRGISVPGMWFDQGEAPEQYTAEGRRTVVTLRFAVGARTITEVGIGILEAHGHRVYDKGLIKDTFFDDRLNDIVYYDGRFWEVTNFQIRGRYREDTILGVTCTETYPEDEYTFDFPPAFRPTALPPQPQPEPGGYGSGPFGYGPYGGSSV
jgi:hypothetical protein